MGINYTKYFQQRVRRINMIANDEKAIRGAKIYYKTHPVEFINDWMITYDPRNASTNKPTTMPFVLFPRQRDYVEWLVELINKGEGGSVEKCRDAGVTEVSCAFSVWAWLFMPGASVGWGSRKEMLVDRIGDPDSIFEKIRSKILAVPGFLMPKGFNEKQHFNYMKIINPENGNTITGEAGTNIGRGGRKLFYFVDESAHCDKQEAIDAALGDNTNTQIHISSVNGTNLFWKRAKAKGANTFIFDWRDDPRKDQNWYNKRKADAEEKGLIHIFKQEVDRDYLAAVEGIMINPAWVTAAVDAHIKLGFDASGITQYGCDVSDEGVDTDALVGRKGSVIQHISEWNAQGDFEYTAGLAYNQAANDNADILNYDSIGCGAGFKTAINNVDTDNMTINGWNAGGAVVNPKGAPYEDADRTNKDFFLNAKAQAWWEVRERFRKTYKAITEGIMYPVEEMISISSQAGDRDLIDKLIAELASPLVEYPNGKVKVESKEKMKDRGIDSPNIADALIMSVADCDLPMAGVLSS